MRGDSMSHYAQAMTIALTAADEETRRAAAELLADLSDREFAQLRRSRRGRHGAQVQRENGPASPGMADLIREVLVERLMP